MTEPGISEAKELLNAVDTNWAEGKWSNQTTQWKTDTQNWINTYAPDQQQPSKFNKHFWINWSNITPSDSVLADYASKRAYISLNAWQYGLIPKIKAANPQCLVFVYKDASSTRSYDSNPNYAMLPAGVSYSFANANHPEWFLRTSGGTRLQYSGYSGHWQMDIGNTAYQAEWAKNVVRSKDYGFDGIWIDNLLWKRDDYHSGQYPYNYATDTDFQNAYKRFVTSVTTQLSTAGLTSVANMSNARLAFGRWAGYLDAGLGGGFDEWWLSVNNNGTDLLPEYTEGWRRQVEELRYTEAAGKIALVQPHFPADMSNATARKAFLYTYASFLCGSDGRSAYTEANGTDQYAHPTPWHAEFDYDLGLPIQSYQTPLTSIFTRKFERGMVVVNARNTGTSNQTVSLGETYLNSSNQSVSSVSLPGTSGAIFRKA